MNIFFCNRSMILKLKTAYRILEISSKGSKLLQYCKTLKTYIPDFEIIKRRAKSFKIDAEGCCSPEVFETY